MLRCNIDVEFALANSNELRWINTNQDELLKINQGRKTKIQKDKKTIHRTRRESTRFQWNKMNKYELLKINLDNKTNRQKGRKTRRQEDKELDTGNIQTTANELLRSRKGGGSIIKISWPKMIVWSNAMLHSSLDDLVND